jgi:hypothetical protein
MAWEPSLEFRGNSGSLVLTEQGESTEGEQVWSLAGQRPSFTLQSP